MAILTKNAVSRRIAAVIEAKYDTYKGDISSTVPSLKDVKAGPIEKSHGFPVVGVYFQRQESVDAPQDTGDDRDGFWIVEAVDKVANFDADNSQRPEDISDVLEYLLKKEKKLLHPSTGLALPWLFQVWPISTRIVWSHTGGRLQVYAGIEITLKADIHEAETY